MNKNLCSILIVIIMIACAPQRPVDSDNKNILLVQQFADAFYSFDSDSLASVLADADSTRLGILYYQKWAKCGHYEVVKQHPPMVKSDTVILYPVTVKDDLMAALRINFNVTDTFHFKVKDGKILSMKTSSNDPDEYYEAKAWVGKNKPELIEIPCQGIWDDGPTPCECIQGMLRGFEEFVKNKPK